MQSQDIVPASEICIHYNIQLSFINSLREYGLIETVLIKEKIFLPVTELERLERILRLRYELDINLEGIETITHLLHRMKKMQEQVVQLTNRLKTYEDD